MPSIPGTLKAQTVGWNAPDFGTRLKSLRQARGLTQGALANHLGIKKPQISRWENQAHIPRPDTMSKLARALDVPPAALYQSVLPTDSPVSGLGPRLRSMRKQKGWTLRECAAAVGVSHVTVTHWENSVKEPRLDMLKKLSKVFGVSSDFLLFG